MRHVQNLKEIKGSLKWIRHSVNIQQHLLDDEIRRHFGLLNLKPLDWVSPLSNDDYAEYSDRAFLDLLGVELIRTPLEDFWPERGPNWDALARSRVDPPQVFLVEAKAHTGELKSVGCGAESTDAKKKIDAALHKTQMFLDVSSSDGSWTGEYYQYANRLAHLYLLRELNDIDAYLVYVCFLNDEQMRGPKTAGKWEVALSDLHRDLGIKQHKLEPYIAHIYIDVNDL